MIFNIFSKELKKLANQGKPDVYQYDLIPEPLRVQIIHIWLSALGKYLGDNPWASNSLSEQIWKSIHDMLARQIGVFNLGTRGKDHFTQCKEYLLRGNVTEVLDIVQISFTAVYNIESTTNRNERLLAGITQGSNDAIAELNYRFREHGVGYQFENGQIIRVDSQYIHAEIVQTALTLLGKAAFKGAEQEFLRAHEHYRHGRQKEAINESLKALESTLKTIFDKRKWPYPTNATAAPLIDIVFKNKLLPTYLQTHFGGLRSTLVAGVPTMRNREGGHGQGATPVEVPDYLVAYALHLTATAIVMLVEAHSAS